MTPLCCFHSLFNDLPHQLTARDLFPAGLSKAATLSQLIALAVATDRILVLPAILQMQKWMHAWEVGIFFALTIYTNKLESFGTTAAVPEGWRNPWAHVSGCSVYYFVTPPWVAPLSRA